MNKKHWLGVLIVLAISSLVLYFDLRSTPFSALIKATKNLNWICFILVFIAMLISYFCEAKILEVLSRRKNEKQYSKWAFFRIPIIQALFNAITPMSTGGQPSQLAAMVQMGMKGGRATSILLMKFIIYQLVVLIAYLWTIIFGFKLIVAKFSGVAVVVFLGFMIHIFSIALLLAAMFAHDWTVKVVNWIIDILARFINKDTVEKWRKQILSQIESFYTESQKLKDEKKKLLVVILLTAIQLLMIYSIPYLVLLSLGIHTSWLKVTHMAIMIIMFMSVIPIPGASGGAEMTFQILFASFISNKAMLVLAMFIWRFATYFFGMILGIFGWMIKPRKNIES